MIRKNRFCHFTGNEAVLASPTLGKQIKPVACGVILVLLSLFGCSRQSRPNQVCWKNQCIEVEVVRKQEDVQRGLQFRKSLGENQGMLFVFSNSDIRSFWMKDTLIPLDMIWINYANQVVHIESNVPPCKSDPCPVYTPPEPALYVLEVNAKYTQQLGLKIGSHLEFHLKTLSK